MKTFEDFKEFSYATRNQDGIYPDLITHDTDYQPKNMTLDYLKKMKAYVLANQENIPALQRKLKSISGIASSHRISHKTRFPIILFWERFPVFHQDNRAGSSIPR